MTPTEGKVCSKCGLEITPSQAWCYYHHTDSTYHLACDPLRDIKYEAAKFRQEHGQIENHRGINNAWTTHEWTDEAVAAFAESCVERERKATR